MFIVTINVFEGALAKFALNFGQLQMATAIMTLPIGHVTESLKAFEAGHATIGGSGKALFLFVLEVIEVQNVTYKESNFLGVAGVGTMRFFNTFFVSP